MKRTLDTPEREDVDRSRCTEMTVKLLVNTDRYASAETIAEEIEQSFEWLAHDHDGILEGTIEWEGTVGT